MKYLRMILYSVSIFGVLNGCKDPNYGTPTLSSTIDYANVMYINASPDAGSLPVLVNNASVATLDFAVASAYLPTVASSEQWRISDAKFSVVSPGDTVKAKADLTSYSKIVGGT